MSGLTRIRFSTRAITSRRTSSSPPRATTLFCTTSPRARRRAPIQAPTSTRTITTRSWTLTTRSTPARHAVNALVHYVEYGPLGKACNPNPLFDNGYYLGVHYDVRSRGENPFAHFLQRGRLEGRPASPTHAELMQALGGRHLLRGAGVAETSSSSCRARQVWTRPSLPETALANEHHVDGRVVLLRRPAGLLGKELPPGAVVLEDYRRSADVLRSSALRLLALALTSESARFAIGDVIELLPGARAAGVPVYFLVLDEEATRADLDCAAHLATRVVFGSRELFQRVAGATGPYPANIVVRPFEREAVAALVTSTLELAARDGPAKDVTTPSRRRSGEETRKVVVPCTDWSVSGVNSALEAIGQELIGRGWDVEIVFTRNRAYVEASAGAGRRLPELPHRWLPPHRAGIDAMWETLIAEIQTEAPCIVFTTYDFYGNSVVPALTNDIGVVMWAQADDGDYYEQTYRLGRYCNAIVCVSNRIREEVTAIHPGIAERAHVIHNTSIAATDVLPREPRRSDKLRIVYTGRLVQYQKRVLDFVTLADELEALGVDFTIDLVGDAPPAHDEASLLLPRTSCAPSRRPAGCACSGACRGLKSSTSFAPATCSSCSPTSRGCRCRSSRRWRRAASRSLRRWRAASPSCSCRTRAG